MKRLHKSVRVAITLALFLTVALLAIACQSAAPQTLAPKESGQTPQAASAQTAAPQAPLTGGKELYVNFCAKCHGLNGLGDGPSVGSLRVQAGLNLTILGSRSDREVFVTISAGKGTEMPPFELRLTPEQRQELVQYIRTLAKK